MFKAWHVISRDSLRPPRGRFCTGRLTGSSGGVVEATSASPSFLVHTVDPLLATWLLSPAGAREEGSLRKIWIFILAPNYVWQRPYDGDSSFPFSSLLFCSRLQQVRDSPPPRRSPRLSQKYHRNAAAGADAHPLSAYSRSSIRTYTSNVLNESGQSVPSSFDEEDFDDRSTISSTTTASTLDSLGDDQQGRTYTQTGEYMVHHTGGGGLSSALLWCALTNDYINIII